MRAALLHLDDALMRQEALVAKVTGDGGRSLDFREMGPPLRLWSRPQTLAEFELRLNEALPLRDGPTLVFSGSGDFHHVTPLLLRRAIEAARSRAVTLLHFDNHPDWVRFENGVHCGSWVGWAARMPNVARVVTVGVCSSDIHRSRARRGDLELLTEERVELYAYQAEGKQASVDLGGRRWPTIQAMGEPAFAAFLPSRIATKDIYITIDKDVLRADDAATNWDQGRISLDYLKSLLAPLLSSFRLIGADVVGDWSPPVYGGGALAALQKRGEALLDQPRGAPTREALAANEPVNLELLALLGSAV